MDAPFPGAIPIAHADGTTMWADPQQMAQIRATAPVPPVSATPPLSPEPVYAQAVKLLRKARRDIRTVRRDDLVATCRLFDIDPPDDANKAEVLALLVDHG